MVTFLSLTQNFIIIIIVCVFVQLLHVFKKVPGFKEIRVLGFR